MAKKRSSLVGRYGPQARAEAFLRYNPEKRGLVALLADAKDQLDASIAAAHSNRVGLQQAISALQPQVNQGYSETGRRLDNAFGSYSAPAQGSIAEHLAQAGGPQAQAIVAAALGEQAQAKGAVETARRADLGNLQTAGMRAVEGEASAINQARSSYGADARKVLGQLSALGKEQGVFTASTLDKLVEASRGRAVTRRGQTLSHRDRQASLGETARHNKTQEQIARQKAAQQNGRNGGKGWLSDSKQESFAQQVEKAQHEAKLLVQSGASRGEATQMLLSGVPSSSSKTVPVYDKATGKKVLNPDGTPKTKTVAGDDGIPQFGDLVTQVALDAAFNGAVSRAAIRRLHERGYRFDRLNLSSQAQKDKRRGRPAPPNRAGTLAPGANGQIRPT